MVRIALVVRDFHTLIRALAIQPRVTASVTVNFWLPHRMGAVDSMTDIGTMGKTGSDRSGLRMCGGEVATDE